MGIFVLFIVLLLEIAGMWFSYWFGAHAFGIGTTWAALINGIVAAYPGLSRYHIHVFPSTIGLVWLAGNWALHVAAILGYIKRTTIKRLKLGNPGMREMQVVEQILRQLVAAQPSAGLPPVQNFGWPLTFSYASGHGTQIYFLGRHLVIGEGLFRNKHFKPLLSCQIGYWNTTDVNIREILACIPPAWMVICALLGFPIGLGLFVTFLFWPWYWRQRVYAGDLFTARVGQLEELITALDQVVHPFEKPKNVLIRDYPLAAERIDRLMRLRAASGMAQSMQGQQQGQGRSHP